MDAAASLPPTIGNYRIERELGRGGMGAVYVGVHQLIGKRAALKVLLPQVSQRADLVHRFFTEARAASAIRHPNIVEVYDYGVDPDGNAYLVMELLEGETLATRLKTHGRLHVPEAVAIARQIALGLGAAHRAGIIHRDLKPDNVFLDGTESKLLDFGVAKLVDDAGTAGPATVTGAILGTPAYMSPEQCEGSRVVDHRSDLYSLGCTLFVMLTGRLPFVETGIGGLIGAHLHTPAPALRDHCATASPELAEIVARLLAKAPDERFQSADALAAALAAPSVSMVMAPPRIAETPPAGVSIVRVQLDPPTPPPMVPTGPQPVAARRRWWPFAVVAAIAAAAVLTVVIVTRRDPAQPERATQMLENKPVEVKEDSKPVDVKPVELNAVQANLFLARKAAAEGKYDEVAAKLRDLAKLAPADPEAAALKAEVAPRAIAVAIKKIAKLREAGKCDLMKAEVAVTRSRWGTSPSLDAAAKACTSTDPPSSNSFRPLVEPQFLDSLLAQIADAVKAEDFAKVVELCRRHPPDRPGLYIACMVSACRVKNEMLALAWMQHRRPSRADNDAINVALNRCRSEAGIDLGAAANNNNKAAAQRKVTGNTVPNAKD